jgi:Flp pilus assembly pilin Flp
MRVNALFRSDHSAATAITYGLVGVNVCLVIQFVIALGERCLLN